MCFKKHFPNFILNLWKEPQLILEVCKSNYVLTKYFHSTDRYFYLLPKFPNWLQNNTKMNVTKTTRSKFMGVNITAQLLLFYVNSIPTNVKMGKKIENENSIKGFILHFVSRFHNLWIRQTHKSNLTCQYTCMRTKKKKWHK